MTIRVALHHKTTYSYDRLVSLSPQVIRLRPAPHCRTPILSYSLKVLPEKQFLNWQQDPYGNFLARVVFPDKTRELSVTVDLIADMTVINPFDFFLEPDATEFPFTYSPSLLAQLQPYLVTDSLGPEMAAFVAGAPHGAEKTNNSIVAFNQYVHHAVKYVIRLEPGVQTCEETLTRRSGSCRDSAWLLVQLLRHYGLAARFVSGYLLQLKPDVASLDGPSGAATDFTDLHAWAEVFLPGAGWVGLDATSGLLAGEGHIPLAATPDPQSASPINGGVDKCEVEFSFDMSITRIHEDPRVTKPYTDEQWADIQQLGEHVDRELSMGPRFFTMGGEPTFVSIDHRDEPEWNTAALGATKRRLAGTLFRRLANRFANGPLLHFGQGKWYPGESLPRWALGCYWRKDTEPVWTRPDLIAEDDKDYGYGEKEAREFISMLAQQLQVQIEHIRPGYEDTWYYLWKARKLPTNVDPFDSRLDNEEERARLARVFEQGLASVVGYVLPVMPNEDENALTSWVSGPWHLRQDRMFLVPGDSPMGYRLPLDSLPWLRPEDRPLIVEADPTAPRGELPHFSRVAPQTNEVHPNLFELGSQPGNGDVPRVLQARGSVLEYVKRSFGELEPVASTVADHSVETQTSASTPTTNSRSHSNGTAGDTSPASHVVRNGSHSRDAHPLSSAASLHQNEPIVRTALCVEPRGGVIHIFMPPVERIEQYLDLVSAIEATAAELSMPVRIEGYPPPYDYRVDHFKVTPDPGVIEVNLQPSRTWKELVTNTTVLYEEAHLSRLSSEKFMLDGRHTGTGGGNHIVMGGPSPAQSPFLRRPDLLRSLVTYWNNRPSLSYLFSGLFIGPTSQAPRLDEARHENLYELEIACSQLPEGESCPPWLVDRVFRHLLTDLTGNTHRAEFCIDKLYSPDSATGRLGLVEMRGFEMPPHERMSLTQQLLVRALIARFWHKPYRETLVRWGTTLHDRFMLPHFVEQDFHEVLADLCDAGFRFEESWFAPHVEFRFPLIGEITISGVQIELRQAIEPWHVLGEEFGGSGAARYVDSSVDRVQVKVRGLTDPRFVVTCNGRRVPLHPTGTKGEFVAGVRFRAWQPPSCLHPTIGVHSPLVFDLLDRWNKRSLGGCTWHVSHPGGRSYATFPVNAYEAESRRVARFFHLGHTPGQQTIPEDEKNRDYPYTLDMRRT
ncbi:DUF2126 domain-containing protein [Schlesneria sp.]|uniref:transglutaminase family protein n=1 Tax=Schlesneria sp. TaxID=2762018 RepID=UPI002F0210F7